MKYTISQAKELPLLARNPIVGLDMTGQLHCNSRGNPRRAPYIGMFTFSHLVSSMTKFKTRNVFKKKTGRKLMDGELYYWSIKIIYKIERPNIILLVYNAMINYSIYNKYIN